MQQLPTTMPLKAALRQGHVARNPKLPLPADSYKFAIRPQNGLYLSEVSPIDLRKAIARQGNLKCGTAEIKIRMEAEQSILIVSTSSPANAAVLNSNQILTSCNDTFEVSSYGVSSNNSFKGVICNISDLITPPRKSKTPLLPRTRNFTPAEGWETPAPCISSSKARRCRSASMWLE
ncbi:hypothetical protein HPB48_016463 [Haemaphysalis longicornis]|uniref:Uncharacterized protein n=1 Tax=Haemaphysalis longicornis TaxID=44386 RepID=A0A9J6FZG8_HAELO|nr:hypothetical protein HPB48_016463 [Haemaphysalis longicornis]